MILDLNDTQNPSRFTASICIIGSGAIGLAIADEFFSSGRSVFIIEAGPIDGPNARTQRLYDCEVTGLRHDGCTGARFLSFGGSTTKWGGQALPLDDIDYCHRPWVPNSGWPITSADLEPYLSSAEKFVGVEELPYSLNLFEKYNLPELKNFAGLRLVFSKWTPRPNLAAEKFAKMQASTNVTLLVNAFVANIELGDPSLQRVKQVDLVNLNGKRSTVSADIFVLCCGGIENPRLMLSSNSQLRAGVGNGSGLVGRYFQDHPSLVVARAKDRGSYHRMQKYFSYRFEHGTRLLPRIAIDEREQRHQQLLNACALVRFQVSDDDPFFSVKQFYRNMRRRELGKADVKHLLRAFYAMPQLATSGFCFLLQNRAYIPNSLPEIFVTLEQTANSNSYVSLSEQCSELGLPLAKVNWCLDEQVFKTLFYLADKLKQLFSSNNFDYFEFEEWILKRETGHYSAFQDIYHHIGTTRMGADSQTSVVDSNLKVWGLENLYIGGTSVFPTGGHSNPTFTAIVLAKRLAAQLKDLQS